MTLTVVAIVKDEATWLGEWLAFHEVVGVDSFLIYDNGSTDGTRAMLTARPTVTVVDWPGVAVQLSAYEDALRRIRHSGWMAFLDADEYLFSPLYVPVPTVLAEFERYRMAVGVCWAVYGTSGLTEPPVSRMLELTKRAEKDNPVNTHVKSIVRPSLVTPHQPSDPHHFRCLSLDTRLRPLKGPHAQSVTWDLLRINHYVSGSIPEAHAKMERLRADTGTAREFDLLADDLSAQTDRALVPYANLAYSRRVAEAARQTAASAR